MVLKNFLGYYASCLEMQKELGVKHRCCTNAVFLKQHLPEAKLVHGFLGKWEKNKWDTLPHTWLEYKGEIIECAFEWLGTDYKYFKTFKVFVDEFKKHSSKKKLRHPAYRALLGVSMWWKLKTDDEKAHYEDGDLYEMYQILVKPQEKETDCGIIEFACAKIITQFLTVYLREK